LKDMNRQHLEKSIQATIDNGMRLLDEAELLKDWEKYPTALALSILAQEEFSKAFLIYLVKEKMVPWSVEIRRALTDHICKQLLGLILGYITPSDEDFKKIIERLKKKNYSNRELERRVADAINVFRHEKIRRWEDQKWWWDEDPQYEINVKKIFHGSLEKRKQNAIYVRVNKQGQVSSRPVQISKDTVDIELAKASNFNYAVKNIIVSDKNKDTNISEILALIKIAFEKNGFITENF